MLHDYHDIRSRIAEPPQWFDEHGVPRYCTFSPKKVADAYADEVVLAEVACQGCGQPFHVAVSMDLMQRAQANGRGLDAFIREKAMHYGDPPNIGCCPAGPTMNSVPRRVLEYWRKKKLEWVRDPALEVDIVPDWAREEWNHD